MLATVCSKKLCNEASVSKFTACTRQRLFVVVVVVGERKKRGGGGVHFISDISVQKTTDAVHTGGMALSIMRTRRMTMSVRMSDVGAPYAISCMTAAHMSGDTTSVTKMIATYAAGLVRVCVRTLLV